ncbi:MAG: hypothetical protein BWY73_00898 [candidate division TA06 bacterium ADurb.Bin417]|uniref:NAD-specific glutamate dehydrogenase n=1 Tax=candidate division TA06 bacterium ADurb.Bin417 TaxID=1852828 RepID=A0A1V5MG37_UNCT6|nr:MAG: hypothetical protein BWY73_00898 [candidate division TA06 bacterium ADurb.Bin417]
MAPDIVGDHRAFLAAVFGDLADGGFQGAHHDVPAPFLVFVVELGLLDLGDRAQQGHAAAGDDAFLDRGPGRRKGVFHAGLPFLHVGLGRSAHVDHRDAAGQFRQAFLELLAVVVAVGLLDFLLDLVDAAGDVGGLAGALDNGGVLLVNHHPLGPSQHRQVNILQLEADILGDGLAAGQDGDVVEHRLAPVAEPGRFHRHREQGAADLVDHQGGQRLALDLLGHDQKGLADLGGLLQEGQDILDRADLLVVDENEGILEDRFHPFGVGDEVGGEVATVELHALDDFQGGLGALGLFDGDDAVLAHLVHGVGDDLADLVVIGRGHGRHLFDLLLALDRLAHLLQVGHHRFNRLLDSVAQLDRVAAGGHVLHALAHDGVSQDDAGGGAVAGHVVGLAGDLAGQLGAHVLKGIGEFHFLGDGDAVVDDRRAAELLLQDHEAAPGAEGRRHRVSERLNPFQDKLSGFLLER